MKSLPRKRRPRDPFWNSEPVASAWECTGAMPALLPSSLKAYNIAALLSLHDPINSAPIGTPRP